MFWFFLWRMFLANLGLGILLSISYAPLATILIAGVEDGVYYMVFGILLCLYISPVLGFIDGFALFFLTLSWHDPPQDYRAYRRHAGLVCATANILTILILQISREFAYLPWDSGDLLWIVAFTLGPAIISAIVMWLIGRGVAGLWYKRKALTPTND